MEDRGTGADVEPGKSLWMLFSGPPVLHVSPVFPGPIPALSRPYPAYPALSLMTGGLRPRI